MKKTSMFKFALMGILALGLMGGDAFAKGSRSSGGFSRSSGGFSRSSGGFSKSSPKKTYSPSKPTTGQSKYKPSTSTSKPKATAPKKTSGGFGKKKVDTKSASYKKTNAQIKKDFGTSNKKYSSMKEAKADLGSKMANKTYTYKDPKVAMANRPAYVPNAYQGHTTVYVGGHYGYYNPMGTFMMYTAAQMMISDAMMHSYAPNAYNQHVVVHRSSFGGVMIGMLVLVVAIGVIVTIFAVSDI